MKKGKAETTAAGAAKSPVARARESVEIALKELAGLSRRIEWEAVERAGRLILDAERKGGRVHVTGVGKPSHVASFVAASLSSTGTPAYLLDAVEAVHGSSGQVVAGDVVIALSNSGDTEELSRAVDHLKRQGARIVGVSRNAASRLGAGSDVFLQARVEHEGDPLNLPPRASVLAKLLVLNALSVYLQEAKALSHDGFRRWHPGGSLGKSS